MSTRTAISRRGFTLVEMVGTCFLLGVLFTITVPMLLVVARERRSAEQRQFALQHLQNLLDETSSKPATELAVGEQSLANPDSDLTIVLPGLERHLTVRRIEGEPETLLIVGSIRWQMASGQMGVPMQLSAWVYSVKGDANAK